MEASLTTARFIHSTLMVVAAATLVFAASLQSATNYDAANRELEAITNVYANQYREFNTNWQNEMTLIPRKKIIKVIREVESDLNIEFGLQQLVYEQILPPWLSGPRFYGTIAELFTDLQNEQVLQVTVDEKELRSELANQIKKDKRLNYMLPDQIVAPQQRPIFTFFALQLRMSTPGAPKIDVSAVILGGQIMVQQSPVTLEFSLSAKHNIKEKPGIRDWFVNTTKIGSLGKKGPLFPALEPFWNKISSMKPLQAYGSISALREISKKDITVMGLTFGQDLAILAAPFAICLLTIYLLCHLKHVNRIVRMHDKPQGKIGYFPWISLFEEKLARLLSDTSIILLPLVANLFLIFKSLNTPWPFLYTAMVLTFVSAVTGLLVRSSLTQLRHCVYEQTDKSLNN